jgi:hypothetical protein
MAFDSAFKGLIKVKLLKTDDDLLEILTVKDCGSGTLCDVVVRVTSLVSNSICCESSVIEFEVEMQCIYIYTSTHTGA